MITLENVYKHYIVDHVPGPWVLQNVSLVIPPNTSIGIVGNKGSGKTTLLRLIAGAETPTKGAIKSDARAVTPKSYSQSFQPLLSGHQNAKFICRINGYADELEERLSSIKKLSGLDQKFDMPVGTYTPQMKASLSFALSMAFDFDVYISDGFNFFGETAFKSKDAADVALKKFNEHTSLIMTVRREAENALLQQYCKAGIWLNDGRAIWFDDIKEAIESQRASQPEKPSSNGGKQQNLLFLEPTRQIFDKINNFKTLLNILCKGLSGTPFTVNIKVASQLVEIAKDFGMELATLEQISNNGCRVKEGAIPVLSMSSMGGEGADYFDLKTQCNRIE